MDSPIDFHDYRAKNRPSYPSASLVDETTCLRRCLRHDLPKTRGGVFIEACAYRILLPRRNSANSVAFHARRIPAARTRTAARGVKSSSSLVEHNVESMPDFLSMIERDAWKVRKKLGGVYFATRAGSLAV